MPLLSLNEVRPRRPEQFATLQLPVLGVGVSMKSGLEGRNNQNQLPASTDTTSVSQ